MRAILVSVAMLVTVTSLSAQATQKQVTFAKNVASILQERCQVCHRPPPSNAASRS